MVPILKSQTIPHPGLHGWAQIINGELVSIGRCVGSDPDGTRNRVLDAKYDTRQCMVGSDPFYKHGLLKDLRAPNERDFLPEGRSRARYLS